ncbi:MAG: sulfatase-like hydrolase/transferase [Pseudomonadales bacterium]
MHHAQTRHATLFLLAVALFPVAKLASAAPNIVFILTDNQSASALASYGNKDVHTPNIDELAKSGVRFSHAYAASGMCSSSRATLMTGLMPSQHGLHNALYDSWVNSLNSGWNAVAEFRSLPLTLRNRGYQTAMIGKWHLGDPHVPALGFEHWVALPYGHTLDFWDNELVENGRHYSVKDQHIVDVLASKAVDYISRANSKQPFFLQLNLDGPYALPPSNYGPARNQHYPRYAEQTFNSMPKEPISDEVLKRIDSPYIPGRNFDEVPLQEIWSHILYGTVRMQGDRTSYANFLSQNSVVDDAVGLVVAALEERDLMDNTVIIYSADQGNQFGQNGSWGHTIWFTPAHLHETSMHIPLIIKHPHGLAGTVSDRMIGQYDITTTLLSLAEIDELTFERSPGRSFKGDLFEQEQIKDWPEAAFFEQEESRGIRTRHYAYWKHIDGMGEPVLYDMTTDADQHHNIYPSMKNSEIVRQLDHQLISFFTLYTNPKYDLWQSGTAKGTIPKPEIWLKRNPWQWMKKYWWDWLSRPQMDPVFSEQPAKAGV